MSDYITSTCSSIKSHLTNLTDLIFHSTWTGRNCKIDWDDQTRTQYLYPDKDNSDDGSTLTRKKIQYTALPEQTISVTARTGRDGRKLANPRAKAYWEETSDQEFLEARLATVSPSKRERYLERQRIDTLPTKVNITLRLGRHGRCELNDFTDQWHHETVDEMPPYPQDSLLTKVGRLEVEDVGKQYRQECARGRGKPDIRLCSTMQRTLQTDLGIYGEPAEPRNSGDATPLVCSDVFLEQRNPIQLTQDSSLRIAKDSLAKDRSGGTPTRQLDEEDYLNAGWLRHYDQLGKLSDQATVDANGDKVVMYTDPYKPPELAKLSSNATADDIEKIEEQLAREAETDEEFRQRVQQDALAYIIKTAMIEAGASATSSADDKCSRHDVDIALTTHGGVCQHLSDLFGARRAQGNAEQNTFTLSVDASVGDLTDSNWTASVQPLSVGDRVRPRRYSFVKDDMMPKEWRGNDRLRQRWGAMNGRDKELYQMASDAGRNGLSKIQDGVQRTVNRISSYFSAACA